MLKGYMSLGATYYMLQDAMKPWAPGHAVIGLRACTIATMIASWHLRDLCDTPFKQVNLPHAGEGAALSARHMQHMQHGRSFVLGGSACPSVLVKHSDISPVGKFSFV